MLLKESVENKSAELTRHDSSAPADSFETLEHFINTCSRREEPRTSVMKIPDLK